jgi:NADPH:quinone reductase-like Zn-dependent oxidoreductase
MKRVQYFHYGTPEKLPLDDVTPPDAGRGQIRVQIRAAAANPMDWRRYARIFLDSHRRQHCQNT